MIIKNKIILFNVFFKGLKTNILPGCSVRRSNDDTSLAINGVLDIYNIHQPSLQPAQVLSNQLRETNTCSRLDFAFE